jgi:quinol monooxygenase YgiN
MSIRLVVAMKCLPGKGDEYAAGFLPRTLETQKEPGCLQYELFRSMENPDTFTLLERWADEAALEVHMGVLRSRPRPTGPSLTEGPPSMEKYEVDE